MVKWVHSVIYFSEMVSQVEPLNNELKQLESEANVLKLQNNELKAMMEELKQKIETYKVEYASCISEAESIKREMSHVSSKVNRSVALLSNLNSERTRWESESKSFVHSMSTIIGDCLLSASFLTYLGYFNVNTRELMIRKWEQKLDSLNIAFQPDLSFIDYLSTPNDRLNWQAKSLPSDDLCTENCIMMHRFNRYPLIIDPAGQATEFVLQNYSKIIRTSFLDEGFVKSLESALRFGNTLLVEDVDHIDPILNPVLNRETQKMGGRVLIRIGDHDVDYSPLFSLFLSMLFFNLFCNFSYSVSERFFYSFFMLSCYFC